MLKRKISVVCAALIASFSLSMFTLPGRQVNAESAAGVSVSYATHVQNDGWQSAVSDGAIAGTTGRSLRLEALTVSLTTDLDLGIEYRSHIQDYGWEQTWHANGEQSGTTGESKRLEALEIRLTGSEAANYDVYYCTHVQNIGWMDWVKNGERSGTEGFSLRQEALAIVILPAGSPAPASLGTGTAPTGSSSTAAPTPTPSTLDGLSYSTHIQNIGWQNFVADGQLSGTTGQSLRLEGIKIEINNVDGVGVRYRTHIQNLGWEATWKENGQVSGTTGESLRLEAIQIELTGPNASQYDIYYRTHVQNIGWLDWAYNGRASGSAGYSYRLEAIEIRIVPAGSTAPGSTADSFRQTEATSASAPVSSVGDVSSYPANVQPYVNSTSDSAFENSIAGFPESYKPYLRALHAQHSAWTFVPVDCGGWDGAIDAEMANGRSLVTNSAYRDPNRPTAVESGTWYNASRECLEFFMDPRSQLGERNVFQFLDLRMNGAGGVNSQSINSMISGTYLSGRASSIYSSGQRNNVNPLFIATHAIQECGANGSTSSRGPYYNVFNICAYSGNNPARTAVGFAQNGFGDSRDQRYGLPWTTMDSSINGGSLWIFDNYIGVGQNTLYSMRFCTSTSAGSNRFWHQYMAATGSARSEGQRMADAYAAGGIQNTNLTFYIPVYSNMPQTACPDPA